MTKILKLYVVNLYKINLLFYYIVVGGRNFIFFINFFYKNRPATLDVYTVNFLKILKNNFFYKVNFYKNSILHNFFNKNYRVSKKLNELSEFPVSKNLQNFLIKNFKFLNFEILINFKALIVKNLLKTEFLPGSELKQPLLFKNSKIFKNPPLNLKQKIFKNFNYLYTYKFKEFKFFLTVRQISRVYKKTTHKLLTYVRKKKFKNFFFNHRIFFFKISNRFLKFARYKLYVWRKKKHTYRNFRKKYNRFKANKVALWPGTRKQTTFKQDKLKFKRFKSRKFKVRQYLINSKNLLKKNFLSIQTFYLTNLKTIQILLYTLQKVYFSELRGGVYTARRHKNKLFRGAKRRTHTFYLFKKHWYFFLKKYFYFLRYSTVFKKLNIFKFLNLNTNSLSKNITNLFSLNKRIFLKERLVTISTLNYYFKSWKQKNSTNYTKFDALIPKNLLIKTRKRIIFLNFDKPLLQKLRETRKLHWFLLKLGKLNKRRYSNFLQKAVSSVNLGTKNYSLIFLFFQFFNKTLSWKHTKLLYSYNLFSINGLIGGVSKDLKLGDLVELCVSSRQKILYNWFKKVDKKFSIRVKRWSYINYCRFFNPELKRKKKLPKILKKLPVNFRQLSGVWVIDNSLACAVFSKKIVDVDAASNTSTYSSSVIKLYNWRYVP